MRKLVIAAAFAAIAYIGYSYAEAIWPWGAPCGVAWSEMEGEWRVQDRNRQETLVIKRLRGFKLGEALFEIQHYNRNQERLGKGFGFWKPGDNGFEVLMEPNENVLRTNIPYVLKLEHNLNNMDPSCPVSSGDVMVGVRPWESQKPTEYNIRRVNKHTK